MITGLEVPEVPDFVGEPLTWWFLGRYEKIRHVCDICAEVAPTIYIARFLPAGGRRLCRACMSKRDRLLGVEVL